MSLRALIIHPDDNVANLIGPGSRGESVQCMVEGQTKTTKVDLLDDIPANHKFARVSIKAGAPDHQVRPEHRPCLPVRSRPGSTCTCTISNPIAAAATCKRRDGRS